MPMPDKQSEILGRTQASSSVCSETRPPKDPSPVDATEALTADHFGAAEARPRAILVSATTTHNPIEIEGQTPVTSGPTPARSPLTAKKR